jgi:GNAT superfamily N-acetyltransferase
MAQPGGSRGTEPGRRAPRDRLAGEPAEEPEVRRHLRGVPRLAHLEALGPFQGRGIGTALIRAGEDTARELGHERLGSSRQNETAYRHRVRATREEAP